MVVENRKLVVWTKQAASEFGLRPVLAKHRLHELDLFSDSALLELFDTYPRDQMQAFTMGLNPTSRYEWQPVDTTGASGKDLFDAVNHGRLWFHFFRVQNFNALYRELLKQLFAELSETCPTFQSFNQTGTLLISSPNALVYYHADALPNLLWHIRGSKRVWVYPAGDRDLVNQELMEDIFASYTDEEVPYERRFDEKATVFELMPGEVLSWPQNAPHRVTNLSGINISLSTVYETEESYRRKLVYCSNRFLRRSYRLPLWSIKEGGIASYLKRFAYRGIRRAGLVETPRRRAYLSKLRIDPSTPNGVSEIPDGPVLTEFSKGAFTLSKNALGQASAVPINSPNGRAAT